MAKIYVHDQWPELLANKGSHKNHPSGSGFYTTHIEWNHTTKKTKFRYVAISDERI